MQREAARAALAFGASLIALGGLGSATAAAAPAATCKPAPTAQTQRAAAGERVDQTRTAGGLQRTAYQDGGVYTATLCDADGAPRKQMTVIPLRLPDGGVAHVPGSTSVRLADGGWRTATGTYGDLAQLDGDWRAVAAKATAAAIAPADPTALTPASPPRFAKPAADAPSERVGKTRFSAAGDVTTPAQARLLAYPSDNKCSHNNWAWSSSSNSAYGYYTNWNSLAVQYRADFTNETIEGFHTWQFNVNYCGFGAQNNIGTAHWGHTNASWDVYDGLNTVDFGPLDGPYCPGAIGCALRWENASAVIVERGIRLNWGYGYTIGRAANHYDLRSMLAHESGHGFGFLDLYGDADRWQTMFGYGFTNDDLGKYQGLGDWTIQSAVY